MRLERTADLVFKHRRDAGILSIPILGGKTGIVSSSVARWRLQPQNGISSFMSSSRDNGQRRLRRISTPLAVQHRENTPNAGITTSVEKRSLPSLSVHLRV